MIEKTGDHFRANSFHPSGNVMEFSQEDFEKSIPERFEKIVRFYPDGIAVKTVNHVVSYGELNAMANRIARVLVSTRGDTPEAIALLLVKNAPLMAAILAVLKAGKFFVLLDSSFSKAQNVALLDNSRAGLVITDQENVSLARGMISSPVGVLEIESIDLSISGSDLEIHILPTVFATIFYTSGSTGEPKGILCDHRDLLHRAMLRGKESQASERDRIALLASGTAIAVTNSFFALLNGAALCPFDTQKEGVNRLASWLSEEKITICPFSTSLFRSFCATLTGKETFSALRIVRVGSETVYKSEIELYKTFFGAHCAFLTGLSSSETGQLTTYLLNDNIDVLGDDVPVGYPVQDKEILLLDDAGNEVGVNQVGEIVVRSRYLATGYWLRPELTEAKFKADTKGNGQRLCFTGDLGLRLPDGCLVHKGRKDFRVKIRGYGLELEEVEKVFLSHPAVHEAVVVTRDNEAGESRLIAYYTCRFSERHTVSDLRKFINERLPDHMTPSAFVRLDALPLNPNGKVDRRALPDPGNARPNLKSLYAPPTTMTEKRLTSIWSKVLSVDQVGIRDNFFDLGGHSLLASRVISGVIQAFKLELPVKALFDAPTIAEMAGIITQSQAERVSEAELAQMLCEVEAMTEEEAQQRMDKINSPFPNK